MHGDKLKGMAGGKATSRHQCSLCSHTTRCLAQHSVATNSGKSALVSQPALGPPPSLPDSSERTKPAREHGTASCPSCPIGSGARSANASSTFSANSRAPDAPSERSPDHCLIQEASIFNKIDVEQQSWKEWTTSLAPRLLYSRKSCALGRVHHPRFSSPSPTHS